MMSKLILITGVSSGFGRALAQEALSAGHRVVGTIRNTDAQRDVEALAPGRAFARLLDVTDFDAIAGVVGGIEADIGPIDVLVNNAGYGHELGDPVKAARAMLAVIAAAQPPAHLLLGSDASQYVRAGMAARLAECDAWDALTQSTDG